MITILSNHPDSPVVQFLTEALEHIEQEGATALCFCFVGSDGEYRTCYHECTYRDLQQMELNLRDLSTLQLIAANHDRVEQMIDDIDYESEECDE